MLIRIWSQDKAFFLKISHLQVNLYYMEFWLHCLKNHNTLFCHPTTVLLFHGLKSESEGPLNTQPWIHILQLRKIWKTGRDII